MAEVYQGIPSLAQGILPPREGTFWMATPKGNILLEVEKDPMMRAKRRLARKVRWNFRNNSGVRFREAVFYTLTYSEENYPPEGESHDPGRDFREFMNRLKNTECRDPVTKRMVSYRNLMYFAAVERGTENHRTHIHVCFDRHFLLWADIQKMWRKGNVYFKKIVPYSYQSKKYRHPVKQPVWKTVLDYIAKYITKDIHVAPEPSGVDDGDKHVDYWREIRGRYIFTSRDFLKPPPADCFPIQLLKGEVLNSANFSDYEVSLDICGTPQMRGYIREGDGCVRVLKSGSVCPDKGERWLEDSTEYAPKIRWGEESEPKRLAFIRLCKSFFSVQMKTQYRRAREKCENSEWIEEVRKKGVNSAYYSLIALGDLYGITKLVFRKEMRKWEKKTVVVGTTDLFQY